MSTIQQALTVAAEQAKAKGQVLGKPSAVDRKNNRCRTFRDLRQEVEKLKIEKTLLQDLVVELLKTK